MSDAETSILGGPRPFPRTSWNLIRQGQDPAAPAYRASLETLYRKYWGPVYFYVRRNWNRDVEAAKDLTQAFFVAFLEKDFLASVDADKGRFRNFVCAALRHFLSKEKRAAEALRRRPPQGIASLADLGLDDSQFDVPGDPADDPEVRFQEDWKRAIVNAVLDELRRKAAGRGKEVFVDLFVEYDLDQVDGRASTYDDLARRYGIPTTQVTNGLHWARREFKALFLRELEEQVASADDLRDEAFELFGMRV